MKIWFRTGHERRSAERGEGQGSEQSRPAGSLRPPDAAMFAPILRPSAARITPADNSFRRGAACCARRSVSDRHRGSRQGTAFYPEPRRAAVPTAAQPEGVSTPEVRGTNSPTTYEMSFSHSLGLTQEGPLSTSHCSHISTRFCLKSRSHRKHTTKPPLPGSRFARCHARTSAAKALSNRELRLLETSLTRCKQTIAPRSNRELSTNRDRLGIDTLCRLAQDGAQLK
jgi:hypothetical protein